VGASLGAGLVSAGVGMAVNFDDANDCERNAASLKVSARDKKELAKRKRTLKAEYESKKYTKTTELRNGKAKIGMCFYLSHGTYRVRFEFVFFFKYMCFFSSFMNIVITYLH
jgi:hypothetical protein